MKFRDNRADKELDLNITPLIDIVFLLLIFFMVSTNFNKITQLNLTLPEVTHDYKSEIPANLNLKISASGEFYVNEQKITHADKNTLMSAIARTAGTNRDILFVISGDKNAPHQAVVTALDAAGEMGFKKVRIAAVKS